MRASMAWRSMASSRRIRRGGDPRPGILEQLRLSDPVHHSGPRFHGPRPAGRRRIAHARNLSDMGIRGAPSSEPWIESNVWLVRSLRLATAWRPVWIGYQPDNGTASNYTRSVADAALAGGRWIVALDDPFRAKLHRHDATALAAWHAIGACIKFAEDHGVA